MKVNEAVSLRIDALKMQTLLILMSVPFIALIYVGITAGLATWVQSNDLGWAGSILNGIVAIAAGYLLVTQMISRTNLAPDGRVGGPFKYIGVSIVLGIVLYIGFMLLIVPGFLMMVRWYPAFGFALIEGESAADALGKSWDATRGHFWPLFVVGAVQIAVALLSVPVVYFGVDTFTVIPAWVLFVSNVFTGLAVVIGTAIGLASYALIVQADSGISEIFE